MSFFRYLKYIGTDLINCHAIIALKDEQCHLLVAEFIGAILHVNALQACSAITYSSKRIGHHPATLHATKRSVGSKFADIHLASLILTTRPAVSKI